MNEMAMDGFRADDPKICGASAVEPHNTEPPIVHYTAIVLAGSRAKHDPIAERHGVPFKALAPIEGIPMVSRVIAALKASPAIGNIIILFDDETALKSHCPDIFDAADGATVTVLPCAGSICDSVLAAVEKTGFQWPYLLTTADHALLTPSMIGNFCEKSQNGANFTVGLVEKAYIDQKQPGSKRTYLPFRRGKYSGANLFALIGDDAMDILRFWKHAERNRKKPWKLFAAFGWLNLIGLFVRRFTVEQAFARGSKALGVNARPVTLDEAEAAIDVDSLRDYEQVSGILAKRAEDLKRITGI